MKAKIFCVVAAFALFGAFQATAQVQYVTLHCVSNNVVQNYAVQTNQVITLVGYDWNSTPTIFCKFSDGTATALSPITIKNYGYNNSSSYSIVHTDPSFYASPVPSTQIVTGVTNIAVTGIAGSSATFKIETPATIASPNYIPANAIVIPTDATGPVQIVLESSADLVNWTSALPGTYGTSATNRFFRVRAIANP